MVLVEVLVGIVSLIFGAIFGLGGYSLYYGMNNYAPDDSADVAYKLMIRFMGLLSMVFSIICIILAPLVLWAGINVTP